MHTSKISTIVRAAIFAAMLFSGEKIIAAPAPASAPATETKLTPTRFSATVEGAGPDIIMLPGLASSISVWKPEADKLKEHFRVHLIQVNGFAGVPAGANAEGPIVAPLVEELAEYIKANDLKQPAVIGHSMGGLVGLMLAEKHPEAVGKLMIVDSLPFFGLLMGPAATVESITPGAKARLDLSLKGTQEDYAASSPQTIARMVKTKGAEADAALKAAQTSDHGVVAQGMYDIMTTDLRPDLGKIKTPVTMLYPCDPSSGFPEQAVDALYNGAFETLPNKRIVRIDGSFHFIQIDQPEAFDREVQAFLSLPKDSPPQ